jgi:hypothetical protein
VALVSIHGKDTGTPQGSKDMHLSNAVRVSIYLNSAEAGGEPAPGTQAGPVAFVPRKARRLAICFFL